MAAVLPLSAASAVTGEEPPGHGYAATAFCTCESELRDFRDFCCETGKGLVVTPVPPAGVRRGRQAHPHRNPAEPPGGARRAGYDRTALQALWSRA